MSDHIFDLTTWIDDWPLHRDGSSNAPITDAMVAFGTEYMPLYAAVDEVVNYHSDYFIAILQEEKEFVNS